MRTTSGNATWLFRTGTRRCGGPRRSKPLMYRALGSKDWTLCHSMTSAALRLGVTPQAVSQACRRQTPLKGYEISLVDVQEPNLPDEEWKPMLCPLSGEEVAGRMVSSRGRVKTRPGLIHRGSLRRDGYAFAGYNSALGYRSERVHRLVAAAFLGPPPSPQHSHVNHKDGDKQNNAASNLEYATPGENRAHYLESRTAQPEGVCRSDSKPVWSRTYNSHDEWAWHPSVQSAAKALGLHSILVSNCIHGTRRQACGYEFQTVELFQALPGEEWRDVDVVTLVNEKQKRLQAGS